VALREPLIISGSDLNPNGNLGYVVTDKNVNLGHRITGRVRWRTWDQLDCESMIELTKYYDEPKSTKLRGFLLRRLNK
jgi:hypothetical protein